MRWIYLPVSVLLLVGVAHAADSVPGQASDPSPKPTTTTVAKRATPTYANVKYGSHERNVMDVWLAPSEKPTPVLIAIHGGGFYTGLKNVNAELLDACMQSGISVVAIAYRYSTDAIAPAPLMDGARAVQFVRSNAERWNLDPSRFACTGGSAGGAMALWLAFHDDMADPASPDPIARESTRMTCAIAINGQSTYDPRTIKTLFPEFDVTKHAAVGRLLGVEGQDLQALTPEQYKLYDDASAITHVSKEDPPVLLIYDRAMDIPVTTLSIGIHHPRFGTLLKEKMQAAGVPCELVAKGQTGSTPIQFLWASFGITAPPATTPSTVHP